MLYDDEFVCLFGDPADGFAFHGVSDWLLDVFEENMILVADVNGSAQRKGGRSHGCAPAGLFEERFVSDVFADSYEVAFLTEVSDADKFFVVGVFVFFFEADFAGYNSDFDFAANPIDLVKAKLLACVLLKDLPVLHNIDQVISPETVV